MCKVYGRDWPWFSDMAGDAAEKIWKSGIRYLSLSGVRMDHGSSHATQPYAPRFLITIPNQKTALNKTTVQPRKLFLPCIDIYSIEWTHALKLFC